MAIIHIDHEEFRRGSYRAVYITDLAPYGHREVIRIGSGNPVRDWQAALDAFNSLALGDMEIMVSSSVHNFLSDEDGDYDLRDNGLLDYAGKVEDDAHE